MKKIALLFSTLLIASVAFAGGSIFGSKSKASNPNGVFSIGVHICGSLNCPNVVLKQGECGEESHTRMQYGVCVCEDGYRVEDDHCVAKEGGEKVWYPSYCATDSDCGEFEQCWSNSCLKILDEEDSCSEGEFLSNATWNDVTRVCTPCTSGLAFQTFSETECTNKCPDREMMETPDGNDVCAFKTCPSGYAKDDEWGECLGCDDIEAWDWDGAENLCNQCSNREMMEDPDGRNVCALKTCPSGYAKDSWGECNDCNDLDAWFLEEPETIALCKQCSNREMFDGRCVLSECPEQSFPDEAGNCISCDDSSWVVYVPSDFDCEAACPNRISAYEGEFSSSVCIKKCDTGYVLNNRGACVSCDESSGDRIATNFIFLPPHEKYCEHQCSNRTTEFGKYEYAGNRNFCIIPAIPN